MALDLVTLSDIAEMAGVSRQRAFILVKRPDFPAALAHPRTGPLWDRTQVKSFLASWRRKRGRPSTSSRSR